MMSADHHVGRIVEARTSGDVSYAEFVAFRSSFLEKLARVALGQKAIIVGDLRGTGGVNAEVAPVLMGMLRADNARIDRAAHVVTAGSTFHGQYSAIVGETRNPNRQVFTSPAALIEWLGPELTPEELARLREFLGT